MPLLHKYASASQLSPIELERQVSMPEAARMLNVSVRTIERHYKQYIRRPSPGRRTMRLGDLLIIAKQSLA